MTKHGAYASVLGSNEQKTKMPQTTNKRIVILGAGTAGTMVANKLAKKHGKGFDVTMVDQYEKHYYQPGFLFYPFGIYEERDIVKLKKQFIPKGVNYLQKEIDRVLPEEKRVILGDQTELKYDVLVIATGSKTSPEETAGLKEGEWYKSIFDFYTFEGASRLREKLHSWEGGVLVVNIVEMPIKCPVAPLEFSFLADDYFKKKGIRDKVTIKYVTPLDGAFTKPKASQSLGHLLEEKNIELIPDFGTEHVDDKAKKLVSYDEREVDYDLLVTIPTNVGDKMLERSGLGDELNFVPTNKHTLQSKAHEDIFVVGDATNLPASKAGSVAHFQIDTVVANINKYVKGEVLEETFDGHANCFVETGNKKALLIDFNYDTEPLEGKFPVPVIGPMKLLKESRLNHMGKLAFRWIYWNMLLRARPLLGISNQMTKAGKKIN